MSLYYYKAIGTRGRKRRGMIDAPSLALAKEKLREQGILVTTLSTKSRSIKRHALKGQQLVTFTTQLSQLVSSGMPLFESLAALEEQYREERCHRILLSLCDQIKGGSSLSQALANHPESFSQLYCSMVASGEASGTLDAVLNKLAILLTQQLKRRKQIITALTYPAVIASFCLIVVVLLLTFAIPSMEALLEGRQLNTFTAVVLAASHFLSHYWFFYVPLAAALVVLSTLFLRHPKGKLWRCRTLLKLPLLKTLTVQAALARFCRTMASLQEGGLPLIDSLRLSRKVMLNPILEEWVLQAENRVIEGSPLSKELGRCPLMPSLLPRMLKVGEESGDLTPMLTQIANLYDSELEKTLTRTTSLIQPLILLIMGGIVGLIMLAVLLPLTDVSTIF